MTDNHRIESLVPEEMFQKNREALANSLLRTGQEVQTLVAELVSPVKGKLPSSILIHEEMDGGYYAGLFIAIEYLPQENKLMQVARRYMTECEDVEGQSIGVFKLEKPIEEWRRELLTLSWILHAEEIIDKLEEMVRKIERGKEIKDESEWAKLPKYQSLAWKLIDL